MNHATNTAGTEFGYVHDYLHDRRPLDASLASVAASMLSMRLAVRDALILAAIRPDAVDADTMYAFAFTIVLAWKLGVLTPRGNAMCLRAFFNNITRVVI